MKEALRRGAVRKWVRTKRLVREVRERERRTTYVGERKEKHICKRKEKHICKREKGETHM